MLTKLQSPCGMTPRSFKSWHVPLRTWSNGVMRSRFCSCDLLTIVSRAWSNAGLVGCTASPGRDTNTGCSGWSRLCDHAAAVQAVRRVPRQNGGHSSCMQILVRTVQNCAADRGDLTGTVLGMVLDAPVVVQQQVPWLETVEVPQLPFFWGSRNAWFDDGYMLCIIQGGSWKNFMIFYMRGLTRLLSSIHVLLFSRTWPAHRRQWQWHVPCWFCWY